MEISEVANAFLGSLEGTLGGGGEEIRKRGIVLFVFLVWHMEVPRLGVKLGLQLPAYTTAQQGHIRAESVTTHSSARSLTH